MSTDALVKTALNYPLNFIFSAYNDPFFAVDLIIKNSSLHRELIDRADAAEVLLQVFAETTINMEEGYSFFNKSETCLRYSNEIFLDYLMASKKIPGLYDGENGPILRAIAERKLAERRALPDYYTSVSITPLLAILQGSEAGSRDDDSEHQGRYVSSTTWYTPLGKDLTVGLENEMSWNEVYQTTQDYTSAYPDATLLAMASNTYNGNCYVWIQQDPTMLPYVTNPEYKSWLVNIYYPPSQQMSKLLNGDFYLEVSSSSDAERIYYRNCDHSAMPYTTGTYKSKWGYGPLMGHAPTYCPYDTSNLGYYIIRTTQADVSCSIVGPDSTLANIANSYSFQSPPFRGITIEWGAEAYSGWTNTYSWNASAHELTCYQPGAYKVKVQGKYNNNVLVYKEKTVVCLPN
jgi:hypothetical protein